MRKILHILAVLLIAGCAKTASGDGSTLCRIHIESDESPKSGTVAPEAFESAIHNLQLLIFNSTGVLEKYYSFSSNPSVIEADLKYGNAHLYVFANYPDLSSVMKESSLSSFWVPLSRNNEINGLIMYGTATLAVPAQTEASIRLERLVARITVNDIDILLDNSTATQALVPTNARIRGASSSVAANGSATIADNDISYSIGGEPPYRLYVYPVAGSSSSSLIVEADFNGATQYYCVDIGQLESNTVYSLSLSIRTLGSPDPDTPISDSENSVVLSVSRWESGSSFTENH